MIALMLLVFVDRQLINPDYVVNSPEKSEYIFFKDGEGLKSLDLNNNETLLLKSSDINQKHILFQTGNRVIYYNGFESDNTSVFNGSKLENKLHLPGGEYVACIKYYESHYVILSHVNSRDFTVTVCDFNGSIKYFKEILIDIKKPLNTKCRGFGAIMDGYLYIWIPRSNEILKIDNNFEIVRIDTGSMTKEWGNNNSEKFSKYLELKEKSSPKEVEKYVNLIAGQITTVQPLSIIAKSPHLGICIRGFSIDGYAKGNENVPSDSLDDINYHVMTWIVWFKDGKYVNEERHEEGLIQGWYLNKGLTVSRRADRVNYVSIVQSTNFP